jgi:CHAD domain-containing protein
MKNTGGDRAIAGVNRCWFELRPQLCALMSAPVPKPTRMLAAQLRNLDRVEAGLPGIDPVHDMRVATRRVRAALRLLRLRKLDQPVKKLQDALGDVRDLQLQIAWFKGRDAALCRSRAALLVKAKRALKSTLREWHAKTLPRLLEAAAEPPNLSLRQTRKILRKCLRRLEQRIERATEDPSPLSVHRARISVKQVRYLFELTRDDFPKAAKLLLAELPPFQYSIGELHDLDRRLPLLRHRPDLLREQKEDRARLAKIVQAELQHWRYHRISPRVRRMLR